jgi:hypothetical protein
LPALHSASLRRNRNIETAQNSPCANSIKGNSEKKAQNISTGICKNAVTSPVARRCRCESTMVGSRTRAEVAENAAGLIRMSMHAARAHITPLIHAQSVKSSCWPYRPCLVTCRWLPAIVASASCLILKHLSSHGITVPVQRI